jgi:pyruvyltransferase
MTILLKQFTNVPNVGDTFATGIVAALTGSEVRPIGEGACSLPNLIAAGSIVHWSDANSTLWGCGLINDWLPLQSPPRRILALRGRLTRDVLTGRGIACGDVLGDPALLLPEFVSPSPRGSSVGVVPHYVDRDTAFARGCLAEGLTLLDVFDPPEVFIARLTACDRILSSSLHGIAIAHAYGIPAAWVELSDRVHGDGFKFFDYYSSAGIAAGEVARLRPATDSLETMIGACFLPSTLPDPALLRAALVDAADSLEAAA